ncbi:E3 ubiquitin-protein ligase SlrP [Candida viswanathii]|uniref:E3 ubiquitin-protein ligase SlrP n=1 Tax=Candida viswanathii TaxID=5486 RepID=A0A367XVT7_9ASCO|nr:E3 ubiquitin-protein ligase SlrP [Candida viswanathii]
MVTFNGLPRAVIHRILEHIPPDEQAHLQCVPGLVQYLQGMSHTKIRIHNRGSLPSTTSDSDSDCDNNADAGEPEMSVAEYVAMRVSNPRFVPAALAFRDTLALLALMRRHPWFLVGVRLLLDISGVDLEGDAFRDFVDVFAKTPVEIEVLNTGYLEDPGVAVPKALRDKTVVLMMSDVVGERHGADELRLLPRRLTLLACRFEKMEGDVERLDFPPALETMHVRTRTTCKVRGGGEGEKALVSTKSDISHLSSLEYFNVWSSKLEPDINHKWILPKTLKRLGTQLPDLIDGGISTMCPDLEGMEVATDAREPGQSLQGLPPTLNMLTIPDIYLNCPFEDRDIPCNELFKSLTDFPRKLTAEFRPKLKLTSGLTQLYIKGSDNSDPDDLVHVDFAKSKFLNLYVLDIYDIPHLKFLGKMPTTLVSLSLVGTPDVDLKHLKTLVNLVELYLYGLKKQSWFSYKLPDSLRKIMLERCGLRHVHIHCAHLHTLSLRGNDLGGLVFPLAAKSLDIPQSVKHLDLSLNQIPSIKAKLPAGLQTLDLSSNAIHVLPTDLPKNLHTLKLGRNGLGGRKCALEFPKKLECLDLSDNELNKDWFAGQDLAKCKKLRKLKLGADKLTYAYWRNKLNGLDLGHLPVLLVELDLSDAQMSSFKGDFRRFKKLETLDLLSNKFSGYFSTRRKKIPSFFGEAIRVVDVSGNGLKKADVDGLMGDLSTMPEFQVLKVESVLRDGEVEETEVRPRKIQRVE